MRDRSTFVAVAVIRCLLLAVPLLVALFFLRQQNMDVPIWHYVSGRSGGCSLGESIEGVGLSRLQIANVEAVRRAMRVVRKDDGYTLWATPYGEFWMPTASGNALEYDIAEQMRNIYGTRIGPGDVVLDAGANVGVFTRKALWLGAGKVIAIEPSPENLECLRRNLKDEIASGRVVLYPKGIWNQEAMLKLAVDPSNSANNSLVREVDEASYVEVPLTTVDLLTKELGLAQVDFIKMDIEGAEKEALAGARETIIRYRPRMAVCTYHMPGDPTKIPELVRQTREDYRLSRACLCALDGVSAEVAYFD